MNQEKLNEQFPPEDIKQREGFNGDRYDYLETHRVIQRLNEAFEGKWSFKVVDTQRLDREVVVLGELEAEGITKQQYGGSDITLRRDNKEPVSLGDDMKGAASDSLKKCATLFGVGLQLYEKNRNETNGFSRKSQNRPGNGKVNPSAGGNGTPKQKAKPASSPSNTASESQLKEIHRLAGVMEMDDEALNQWVQQGFSCTVEKLSYDQGTEAISLLHQKNQESV